MLLGIDNLDDDEVTRVLKAPFAYPGGKSRSVPEIIPKLPRTDRWCDVFGGSGVVTLNRKPCRLEVYNDRHSGLTAFFRCIQDDVKYDHLCMLIENSLHTKEDFYISKEMWAKHKDDVWRAYYWYYMVTYSFGSLGRNFGRQTQSVYGRLAGRLRDRLTELPRIRDRFKNIQIENMDVLRILKEYDHQDMVFYMDPPYIESSKGVYKWEMSPTKHGEMLDLIFSLKGFVAISGYSTPLYEKQPWDNRYSWEVVITADSPNMESNYKSHYETKASRNKATEVLWIKDFK